MKIDIVKYIETQNEIIHKQQEAINELLILICQFDYIADPESLGCMSTINEAALLTKQLED